MSVPKGSYLLDVNVLVALFDPAHTHHEAAHGWFARKKRRGWATCPLTENGLVRVLSNPAYPSGAILPAQAAERLAQFCDSPRHAFWPDDLTLRDGAVFDVALLTGTKKVTDVYLLALAGRHGGKLATFDRKIPRDAVHPPAREALEVIG